MPYFYVRLDPPRPTFPGDMTDEEREAMLAHAHYWGKLAKTINILAMGPVATSTGAFGMGVIEVESLDEAQSLTANDPVVRAGLGFQMTANPMFGMIKS